MATHNETITIATSATHIYPTAPVTAGNRGATASFTPPSDIYLGDDDVTTSNGRLVTSADSVEWNPGVEDLYAVAGTSTDINVLFTNVDKGELGGIINISHTAPGS